MIFECLIVGDDQSKAVLREFLASPPACVTSMTYRPPKLPVRILEWPTVVTSSTGDDARSSLAWTGGIPLTPDGGVTGDLAKLVRIQASSNTRY